MATYIVLANWSPQGMEKVKESPERTEKGRQFIKGMGGELKAFYLVMGQYDQVWVVEAPDDETMARICLTIGSQGNIHTVTMRAWTEGEYKKLCAELPTA